MEASGQLFHPPALWQDWLHRLFPSLIIGNHILPWILFPRLHKPFLAFHSISWTLHFRLVKDFLLIQYLGFQLQCSAKCPLLSLTRKRGKVVLTFHLSLEKCVACSVPLNCETGTGGWTWGGASWLLRRCLHQWHPHQERCHDPTYFWLQITFGTVETHVSSKNSDQWSL